MKDQNSPKVSIVIPVYNGSNYLSEAIDSALSQTYKNIEIIVVNDGSTDDGKTDAICKSYGKKIRYFKKENGGAATALNYGIDKMKGEYFSWLSHDDIYLPDKVETQVLSLSKLENKKTIIFSGYQIIDDRGNFVTEIDLLKKYKRSDLQKSLFPFFHMCLNGCTMLIHRSHFDRVGKFNPELPTTQDYDLWFRMFRNADIYYDKKICFQSRSHSEQDSRAHIDTHVDECNRFWLGVIKSTTEDEMIKLSGSVKDFYQDIYASFKELTLYDNFINHLYDRGTQLIIEEYQKEQNSLKRNILVKELASLIGVGSESNIQIRSIDKFLNFEEKSKKRVLLFTAAWFDRGGLNRMISLVSSMLVKDFDVIICSMRELDNEKGYDIPEDVKYIELEPGEFLHIPKILKLLQVDVFIGSNNCFVPFLNLYKEISRLGIKTIMWNHENYFLPYYQEKLNKSIPVRKKIYKCVDVVLWLTKTSAFLCSQFTNNVMVIGNSVSLDIKKLKQKEKKEKVIISVGRFNSYQKRLDRLLIVFSEILKKDKNIKLLVVGSYDLDLLVGDKKDISVYQLIKNLKIPTESIIFTGEINNVGEYYSKAMVNVMTSEREGFGLTILEAAQLGIPSVVFSGGGSSDIIEDGVDGCIVEDGNTSRMADEILELLGNSAKYKKVSKMVLIMAQKYSIKNIGREWRQLIKNLLEMDKQDFKVFLQQQYQEKVLLERGDIENLLPRYEEVVDFQITGGILNKELLNKLEEKDIIIEKLENSKSWKITKPLRFFTKGLMLIKENGFVTTLKRFISKH
jgi:glycosyltransferase involved in cell wall biosynthesis/GT2 family glycosyltransferase